MISGFCALDGLPMIRVGDIDVCVSEWLLVNLHDVPISDILTGEALKLVFQNGCVLPLFCVCHREPMRITSEEADILLSQLSGLRLVGIGWTESDGLASMLLLHFADASNPDEAEFEIGFEMHPISAAKLQVPPRQRNDAEAKLH